MEPPFPRRGMQPRRSVANRKVEANTCQKSWFTILRRHSAPIQRTQVTDGSVLWSSSRKLDLRSADRFASQRVPSPAVVLAEADATGITSDGRVASRRPEDHSSASRVTIPATQTQ
jgi:hypothetical protein